MVTHARTTRLAFRAAAVLLASASFGAASMASASSTSQNMVIGATVTKNCTLSTTPIAFGNIDVTLTAAVDGTGGLSVTCTADTQYTLTADQGGTGTSLTDRKMAGGTAGNTLDYALFTDSARTQNWGDGSNSDSIIKTGDGTAQATVIYGQVTANQTGAKADTYADTVAVTITY